MNYALELLRRGRGRRSDVKNKGRNSGQGARKNNNDDDDDMSMQNGQKRIMDGWKKINKGIK